MKSTPKSTSALLIACVLGLSACGSSTPAATGSSTSSTSSAATTSSAASASASPMVSSASSSAPAVASSTAQSVSAAQSADSSPAASAPAASSVPQESTAASSTASTSSSSAAPSAPSTRSESTISGSGGVIKAGASSKLPAKVGSWVKAPGASESSGTVYHKGNSTVVLGFLPGSDYAGISTNVTHSRTKVGTGVCGSTESASNLTCYLKTADGVLNVSSDANDTPLVALVDFVDQLTTILGKS